MIPKTRPTIGDSKPRTIDRIPKTSDGFFFSFIFKKLLKLIQMNNTIKISFINWIKQKKLLKIKLFLLES